MCIKTCLLLLLPAAAGQLQGVPRVISNIIVVNTVNSNNNITLTLSWGEPFNNFDPIVNYTVSCSGDVMCPPSFTTTDNTTRSYTITNLTTMTTYTFSVVATNSIGSGEAGVVMITTPSSETTTTTSISSVFIGTTIQPSSTIDPCTTNPSSTMCGMVTDDNSTKESCTCESCDSDNNTAIIGTIVGVDCIVIIIMVITNIMIWIYCFRRRDHTGTSSELHKPTKDTVNPAYHTITDENCTKTVGEPISYYEEVNKSPVVKMTQNPAYAAP